MDASRPPDTSRISQGKRPVGEHPTSLSSDAAQASLTSACSELHLAPATRTSVVTTTTTTTIHFAPILIPKSQSITAAQSSFTTGGRRASAAYSAAPLTPTSTFAALLGSEERRATAEAPNGSEPLRLDPKMYPLSQSSYPGGLKRFKMQLGGHRAVFFEGGKAGQVNELGLQGEFNSSDFDQQPKLDTSSAVGQTSTDTSHEKGRGIAPHSNVAASNPFLSKTDRGPLHQRRLSRRPRNSISGHGLGVDGQVTGDDTIEEDDEGAVAYQPSFVLDAGAMLIDGEDTGPPRKRPRATSIVHRRSPSGDFESADGTYGSHTTATGFNGNTTTNVRRESIGGQSHMSGNGNAHGSLPSPNLSPPSPVPTFAEDECQDDDTPEGAESPTQVMRGVASETLPTQLDLGSGLELSGLLSLPDFVRQFDALPPSLQSYFIFTFLKRSPIPVLQTINNIIAPALRRDFLTDLPPELGVHVLGFLDAKSLCRASTVCKGWRRLVDGDWRVWKQRLVRDELWIGDGSEEIEAKEILTGTRENLFLKRWRAGVWDDGPQESAAEHWASEDYGAHIEGLRAQIDAEVNNIGPSTRRVSQQLPLASPLSSRESSPFSQGHFVHPFKKLYKRRFEARGNWTHKTPKSISFACNANNVVTCLQFDKDKIVSASDDHSIHVWNTRTGEPKARLQGHEGGVWALQYIGNVLVSGSTDRTVRVWDLEQGRCTHTFVGHTSTVRCLQIVEPQNVNPDPSGAPIWEPAFPLIVTGSRDWSLRVWKLPTPGKDPDYQPLVPQSPTEENTDPVENPYHLRHLSGHRHAVRALAAHGRVLVSGSYDSQVRVWDIMTGQCLHRLTGHTQKVYSVVYDHRRAHCASGSMDGTVRLWSTETGECLATLDGHSSLVGLLGLSHRNLVSAAADSTLRIWDPSTGACRHTLAAHSGAITCFQHDEYKVVSGSDGTLKMWDVRDGSFTRDLLTGLTGVWQVAFDRRFCVAAIQRNGQSEFEVLDFFPEEDEDEERNAVGEEGDAAGVGEKTSGREHRRGSRRGQGGRDSLRDQSTMVELSMDTDEYSSEAANASEDGSEGMADDTVSNRGTGGFNARHFSAPNQGLRSGTVPRQSTSSSSRRMSQDALFGAPILNNTIVTPHNGLTSISTSTVHRSPSPNSALRRRPPSTMLRAEEFPRRLSTDSTSPFVIAQATPNASTSQVRQLRRITSANRLNHAFATPVQNQNSGSSTSRNLTMSAGMGEMDIEDEDRE